MTLLAFPYTYTAGIPSGNFAVGTIDWEGLVAYFFVAGPVLNTFSVTSRQQLNSVPFFSKFPNAFIGNNQFACGKNGVLYIVSGDGNIYPYFQSSNSMGTLFNYSGISTVGYCACFENVDQYVICAAQNSGVIGALIFVVDMSATPPAQAGAAFNVDEHDITGVPGNARVCRGNGYGVVAAIDGAAATIGFYKVTPTGHSKIGTVTSVGVDGSTSFTAFNIPGFDFSDNNIVICLSTALNNYIMKIDSNTCAIKWKTIINGPVDLNESKIIAGKLEIVEPSISPYTYYHINLSTGAITNTTVETVLNNFNGKNYFNDKLDWLIANTTSSGGPVQWATFGPPPYGPITQGGVIRLGG
jgi:hypothetical protein